ncbi:sulfotransferase [Pseudomonas lactucae]|uniref:sulfotransferase n=1 Tax=Pseudomonas lactucae TaxID=2813360 RepID=UPI002FCCF481
MNNAFIIGTGRCGTTYLAQILNAHSKVCVPPEMQCVFEYDTNGSRFYETIALGAIADAKAAADLLERSCPHDLARFFNYREYCEGLTYPLRSMQAFFSGYYEAIAKSHGKEVLVEQTPWYGQRLDIMTQVFPDAKFVHVVRDGRDVALSFARTPWWFKKPELNLARWANEIKKIATDAAALLLPENYLVVKYEDLVANTHAEVSRICDFLGIALEPAQLDPAGYIDYDSYCRFDMENLSSSAYLNWKKNKGSSSSFQGSAYAWKKDEASHFRHLPDPIKNSLSLFGYDVPDNVDEATPEQSANYNVKMFIGVLEAKVVGLSETVAGRELTINDQSVHIRSVESELLARAQRIAEFEQELVARNEHIAGLNKKVEDLTQSLIDHEADRLAHIHQASETSAELSARGKHISNLNQLIDDQIKHIAEMAAESSARGEHISNLNQLIDNQTKYIADLVAELAVRAEQFATYEAEVVACAERKAVLEKALNDQVQHIRHLESELLLCGDRVAEHIAASVLQTNHMAELDLTIAQQSDKLRVLEDKILSQEASISELNADAQRMKEALDLLNASWCGRLQAFRQKFHK